MKKQPAEDYPIYPTPPLRQDMIPDQILSEV